jgi:DNA-binding PadR family transcriptional regulator
LYRLTCLQLSDIRRSNQDFVLIFDNITYNDNMTESTDKLKSKADLILHPIRWRIIQSFVGRSELSARQVCAILTDVPPATLYRQFQKLAKAELITVVAEKSVRGTVEKIYALQEQNVELSPAELKKLSHEDHQRYFTLFVVSLLADFDRYLQQDVIDLAQDGVGYRQVAINLSVEELGELTQALQGALKPFLQQKLTKKRQRFLFSTIVMPENST